MATDIATSIEARFDSTFEAVDNKIGEGRVFASDDEIRGVQRLVLLDGTYLERGFRDQGGNYFSGQLFHIVEFPMRASFDPVLTTTLAKLSYGYPEEEFRIFTETPLNPDLSNAFLQRLMGINRAGRDRYLTDQPFGEVKSRAESYGLLLSDDPEVRMRQLLRPPVFTVPRDPTKLLAVADEVYAVQLRGLNRLASQVPTLRPIFLK